MLKAERLVRDSSASTWILAAKVGEAVGTPIVGTPVGHIVGAPVGIQDAFDESIPPSRRE
jgi:hypothetical protein